jgi:cytochrome c-type biogenesis protein CcmH/NrfF/thiol-disulfide isomerase/thioredoxin
MNKHVATVGVILMALLLGLLSFGMFRPDIENRIFELNEEDVEGLMAPQFDLERLDGEGTISLAQFRGQPLVVNFWATWCAPCAQEHPTMLAAARRYQSEGVAFLGVLYGDEPELARGYEERMDSAYETVLDPDQRTAVRFGATGVPETYFISRTGIIVKKVAYPIMGMAMFDSFISEILVEEEAGSVTLEDAAGLELVPFGTPVTSDVEVGRRAHSLGQSLRCPVCRSQAVADSSSPAARAMRQEIESMVREGYTDDQIIDFFADLYGDGVLLAPPKSGVNLVAWFAPLFAILVGGLVLLTVLRRQETPAVDEADPFAQQFLAELEEE